MLEQPAQQVYVGVSFYQAMFLVLFGLKIAEQTELGWLWVTSPIWITWSLVAIYRVCQRWQEKLRAEKARRVTSDLDILVEELNNQQ